MAREVKAGPAATSGAAGTEKKAAGFKPQPDSKRAIVQGVLASAPNGMKLGELIELCQKRKQLAGDEKQWKKAWRRAIRKAARIEKVVFAKSVKTE